MQIESKSNAATPLAASSERVSNEVTGERIERANHGVPYKTIGEAAAVLRKGPRWLASWLKAHPVDRHGEPFYHSAGRTKLFTDHDIDRIRLSLPCLSPCVRHDRRNQQVTKFVAPISDTLLNEAHELLTEGSRSKSKSKSSARSRPGRLHRAAD
jgi:hypothetical protein